MMAPTKKGTYFIVEEILDKRFQNGKAEFLIKWKDYESCDNSWEPKKNLVGSKIHVLMKEFECKRKEKGVEQKRTNLADPSESEVVATTSTPPPRKKTKTATATMTSSANISGEVAAANVLEPVAGASVPQQPSQAEAVQEAEPEAIVGVTKTGKELELKIKWKNCGRTTFVPLREAREKWTQLVIDYFEQQVTFDDDEKVADSRKKGKASKRLVDNAKSSSVDDADKIIRVGKSNGEMVFIVKWKVSKVEGVIPRMIANDKWPQLVISYYEKCTTWEEDDCVVVDENES